MRTPAAIASSSSPAPSSRTGRSFARLLIWLLTAFLVALGLLANQFLVESRPLDKFYEDAFAQKWVPLRLMNPEIQAIARNAHLGDRPGNTEAFLSNLLIDEETRIELALQGHRGQGLTTKTETAEFVCMVWGCTYENALRDFREAGIISSQRCSELVCEAKRLSLGKTYWNSPAGSLAPRV